MSTIPPKRFKVEPIETTVTSSKNRPNLQDDAAKPRRRFAPEPVETIATSSKDRSKSGAEASISRRRFAPNPVETTVKSSKDRSNCQEDNVSSRERFAQEWAKTTAKTDRRFAPEPVETTVRSNRDKPDGKAVRRFKPEPIETTQKRKQAPRKFAPQLIETAQRTRKAGDKTPAVLPSDKTEATPDVSSRRARIYGTALSPLVPDNSPACEASQNPFFLEVKRQASPISVRRPISRASTRHSFRVPELDPIESSESEGSSPASPSTSPSAMSDHSFMYKEATRMRESVDDRVSGYLLGLAARAAEKQLREQAMAAFPNDDHHEPVDHFIGRDFDEADTSMEETKRRHDSSFTEVNWDLQAMRQYREETEKQKQQENEKKRRQEAELNRNGAQVRSPWGNAAALLGAADRQRDPEMDRMRKGARPPMLGGDIKFPRCPSPEPARFDPTQGTQAMKKAMCYLTEQSNAASEKGESLWCGNKKTSSNQHSVWSSSESRPPSRAGLWGGCCVNSGLTPPRGPTGILTPRIEIDNPLSPCPTPNPEQLPPSPPASQADFASIDEKLTAELAIEEEFGDDFVTQVYNYLSLGYPSIARDFDSELGRISQISTEELRQDDHLVSSKGYIRLGADGNLKDAIVTEEACSRWRALRTYIHEWARQQPGMQSNENVNGGIGVAVRRGSWAL